jgi:uncharacterized membrane protein
VREGSPAVVLGATVVVALFAFREHDTTATLSRVTAIARLSKFRFIPLSTVNHRMGQ